MIFYLLLCGKNCYGFVEISWYDTSYKTQVDFHLEDTKEKLFYNPKPKFQIQKLSFSSSTNIQFTIWEQFLQFKAYKSVQIDAIGIEVAQQITSSGCPTKGHLTTKNAFLALLVVK